MMSFKCSNHRKIVFDHVYMVDWMVDWVLMSKIRIKYQYASQLMQVFRIQPVCVLFRKNTVFIYSIVGHYFIQDLCLIFAPCILKLCFVMISYFVYKLLNL